MSLVLVPGADRAVIFNRVTGQVLTCSVPTALENVANAGGVWVHGETGEPWDGPAVVAAPEPVEAVIPLAEEDVLPLPAPEPEADPVSQAAIDGRLRPFSDEHVHVPAATDPLDHDGNGKKGGARAPVTAERKAVIAALKAKGVSFFAGSTTEKLKEILAAS